MADTALQNSYPDELSHCYGCGRLNEDGLCIKSFWEGDEAVCHFRPRPYHTGPPGYVYGGLIASLIDCHSTATASATAVRREDQETGATPAPRYVTASLHVDYRKPTPIDAVLELRAHATEVSGRKIIVTSTLSVDGIVCAEGTVVTVEMPETMRQSASGPDDHA
ncbi:MAG: PaaI family thioesterase [Coriobacteriia bacterium]|nr:PaaI family thioesterase [Coriobacteriia bacterium]